MNPRSAERAVTSPADTVSPGTTTNSSSRSMRRSFPWLRRARSPSRSTRVNRLRSIDLNGSFKSASSTTGGSSSSGGAAAATSLVAGQSQQQQQQPSSSSIASTTTSESPKKSRRGRRRPKGADLAEKPSIRPALSTQKSWKDTFKIPRSRGNSNNTNNNTSQGSGSSSHHRHAAAAGNGPANHNNNNINNNNRTGPTTRDVESENSSTHRSSHSVRKQRYVPHSQRADRLPVSGPPRTIVADRLSMVHNSALLGESQTSFQIDDMLEPEIEQIEEESSTIHDTDVEDRTRTPTSRHIRQGSPCFSYSHNNSEAEIPTFLDATSLYSDTDQALHATRRTLPDNAGGGHSTHSHSLRNRGRYGGLLPLTIAEGSSWLGGEADMTAPLNNNSSSRRHRDNSRSRHTTGYSESTSLAGSSAVYSIGYMSSACTSLENSSFSRRSYGVNGAANRTEDGPNNDESAHSLDIATIEQDDDVENSSHPGEPVDGRTLASGATRKSNTDATTDPQTAQRLADIERENEMLEMAIQRSLNDSTSFQFHHTVPPTSTIISSPNPTAAGGRYPSRQCALYTPPNPLQSSSATPEHGDAAPFSPKGLGAFLEEHVAEDEKTAEMIAENELLELAMERSIVSAASEHQQNRHRHQQPRKTPHNMSFSCIEDLPHPGRRFSSLLSKGGGGTDPGIASQSNSEQWDSWQDSGINIMTNNNNHNSSSNVSNSNSNNNNSSNPNLNNSNSSSLQLPDGTTAAAAEARSRRPNIRSRSVEIDEEELRMAGL